MKKSTFKRGLAYLLILIMCLSTVIGCSKKKPADNDVVSTEETTQTETETISEQERETVTEISKVLTANDVALLGQYPNLKKVDATGSTCYEELLSFANSHPQVEVLYNVSLGGTTVVSTTESSVKLSEGSYTYDTLKSNLKYLPKLSSIVMYNSKLTEAQINSLRSAYPSVTFKYSAAGSSSGSTTKFTPFLGSDSVVDAKITLDSSWPVLDWTNITSNDINTAKTNAAALTGTQVVKLNSSLSITDVKALQQSAPNIIFDYSFTLYGKQISTLYNSVAYKNVSSIGTSDPKGDKAKEALEILTKCTYFKLDNCGMSNEVMAEIRDKFPNKKVVWRIYHKTPSETRSWLTDTEVLMSVFHVNNTTSAPYKYLTSVKYVDLGHNTDMKDISFLSYMPNLEIVILSGSPITDIKPLANHEKLEFVEVAWCGHLTDVSILSTCPNLKYLNIGQTTVPIPSLTALKSLPLEMLSCVGSGARTGATVEQWNAIQAEHPNCWITYNPLDDKTAFPYSKGWRYKADSGYTTIYRKVRDVFDYDSITVQKP